MLCKGIIVVDIACDIILKDKVTVSNIQARSTVQPNVNKCHNYPH